MVKNEWVKKKSQGKLNMWHQDIFRPKLFSDTKKFATANQAFLSPDL